MMIPLSSHPAGNAAHGRAARALASLVLFCPALLAAQTPTPPIEMVALSSLSGSSSAALPYASPALPEAPVPQLDLDPKTKRGSDPADRIARKSSEIIPAGWHAQPLSPRDKVRVGIDDIFSIETLGGAVLTAGYEHVTNGEPNYGTDRGAFAARFGAAALRETTQDAFTDMLFASLLHEDPRYYIKGQQYNPIRRLIYAGTRPLITRKDNGSSTLNGALLLGYAASAALTPAYYPSINRNFHDVASVYGGSIGGAALGFVVTEFSEDFLQAVHLKHKP